MKRSRTVGTSGPCDGGKLYLRRPSSNPAAWNHRLSTREIAAFVLIIFLCSVGTANARQTRRRHVGFREDVDRYSLVRLAKPLTRGGPEAASPFQLSLKQYMPRPGDQGENPTDASWAVTYAALTCMKSIAQNATRQTARDSLAFSPGFVSAIVVEDKHISCEQGISLTDALESTLRVGAVHVQDFPSECQMIAPRWLRQKASANRISAYFKLFETNDPNKSLLVKRSLIDKKPVVAALRLVPSFLYGDETWEPTPGELGRPSGAGDTAVAVTVVGYDDSTMQGVFEIMGSLGRTWGKDGFAKVSYHNFEILCLQAFTMYTDSTIGATTEVTPPAVDSLSGFRTPGFSGTVTFLDQSRTVMETSRDTEGFRFTQPYPNNHAFRIRLTLGIEGYVYAFSLDNSSPFATLIFPDNRIYLNNHLAADSSLTIPDPFGNAYCALDSTAGTDYICVLVARQQVDIRTLFHNMVNVSGTPFERIFSSLGPYCVPAREIQSSESGSLRFWTSSSDKSFLPLLFAIDHVTL